MTVSTFLEHNRVVRSIGVSRVRENPGFALDVYILDTNDDGIANCSIKVGHQYLKKTYWEPALTAQGYDFMRERGDTVHLFDARSDEHRVGDHTYTEDDSGMESATRDLRPMAQELDLEPGQHIAFRADTGQFLIYEPLQSA